jgi:catechol 2,3-dioxygenase-like lactoylglutathione lyase family enzyme
VTPVVRALRGATIGVEDVEATAAVLEDVLGWERHPAAPLDATAERRWGIAAGSAGARALVVGPPGAGRGLVRLVGGTPLAPSPRLPSRWMGVEMVVSVDVDGLAERLAAAGYAAVQAPRTFDWSDVGSNVHRSVVVRGPGGTRFAFTRPLTQPAGRAFHEALAPVGQVFSVQLCTTDREAVRRFYRHGLGMATLLSKTFTAPSVWHDFLSLGEDEVAELDLYKGDAPGSGLGGVEVQTYAPRRLGRDPLVLDRLDPGVGMVTLTAADLGVAYDAARSAPGARVLSPPEAGGFALLGAEGERLEVVAEDAPW